MKRRGKPPYSLLQWVEFLWVSMMHPAFKASRDKHKTYYEYRLAKSYQTPFE